VLLHVCSNSVRLESIIHRNPLSTLIDQSTTYFLLWLRDMQVIHPVAAWCWRLVRALYNEHPAVRE
jgi:hypothetical protein